MFDIDEIMRRAEAARDAASQQLNESMEKSRKIAEQTMADTEKADAERTAAKKAAMEEVAENRRRRNSPLVRKLPTNSAR